VPETKTKPEPSARAKRVWQRLIEWYGARIVEQYGESPPDDWAARDRPHRQQFREARPANHPRPLFRHPPTLPQFDQAMSPPATVSRGPNPAEILAAFVMRTRVLTRQADSQPLDVTSAARTARSAAS